MLHVEVVEMTNRTHHDVIIIGAGASGLSAGLVLARARADVLLIDAGQPRNATAARMHGFISRDGIPPAEFLALGKREIEGYGGTIRPASVKTIEVGVDGTFVLTLADGSIEGARALLVATGLSDQIPRIPGVRDRWGTLVHHCPYCHGHEVRDQAIVVLGGPEPDMSLKQAGLLRRFSNRVSFVTNGIEPTATERRRLEEFGVRVIDGTVSHLVGEPGLLDGVALAGGTIIECEAVFAAPPRRPNDGLLRSLGCAIDGATGLVATNDAGETSVPGVWAAGNVVTPGAQVITAAGAASSSAIAINGWLLQQDLAAADAARA
jgi:thioredoxin reductase